MSPALILIIFLLLIEPSLLIKEKLFKALQNNENDCYKKATLELTKGCQSLEGDNPVDNMKYAVMLTLCELLSAKINIPSECNIINIHQQVVQCTQQLSLSPQTWTTYSGYFRDIVLICFAIKYPMEKEILERLHENITLNQVKNFNILSSQQRYLIQWREEEFKRLDKLKESQLDIFEHVEKTSMYYQRMAHQVELLFETLVLLQNQTELSILQYNDMVSRHVEQVQMLLQDSFLYQAMKIDETLDSLLTKSNTLNQHVERILLLQEQTVQSWNLLTKNLERELTDVWNQSIYRMSTGFHLIMNQSLSEAKLLKHDLTLIHRQVKDTMEPFHRLSNLISGVYFQGVHTMKRLIVFVVSCALLCLRIQALLKQMNVHRNQLLTFVLLIVTSITCQQAHLNTIFTAVLLAITSIILEGIILYHEHKKVSAEVLDRPEIKPLDYTQSKTDTEIRLQKVPNLDELSPPPPYQAKDTYYYHRYYYHPT
ncbi:hypothetical protein RMCBS344292_11171 [Rhizopus microsporus]|nr:hypothetical protein RMCBS344292_11171 [Rhizopus microsporus]